MRGPEEKNIPKEVEVKAKKGLIWGSKREAKKPNSIPYLQLYRHATVVDKLLIAIGSLAAMINGATLPVMTIFFGI